jgi:hypothetical protein
MSHLGIKTLTTENWLDTDPIMAAFVQMSLTDGSKTVISADKWATRFLRPQLDPSVPEEILRLFEVARGSIAYGYFFYPLFTLAAEQLLRVAEAAVASKCALIRAPRSKTKYFHEKLTYLRDQNIITKPEYEEWNLFREGRNIASHPKRQTLLMPKDALLLLINIAEKINRLFT